MRVIILAAGQSFHLDGINKTLMKDPLTNKSLMTIFSEAFEGYNISVVVGHKAIELIQEYPDFEYIYNPDWAVTANSYSLGLALTKEPCYVISGDLIIENELIEVMNFVEGNCILTEFTENRRLTSLNCSLTGNVIDNIYQGPLRDISNPEIHGIFKVTNPKVLTKWKYSCLRHGNLSAGQTLPVDTDIFYAVDKGSLRLDEVDTVQDYIRLVGRRNCC